MRVSVIGIETAFNVISVVHDSLLLRRRTCASDVNILYTV